MKCMKCGRETTGNQVFCDACLRDMEKYPVKPGTAVQLPTRQPPAAGKKQSSQRRVLKPEEQVVLLRRCIRGLTMVLVVLILALCLTVAALVHALNHQTAVTAIGQNYSTSYTTPTDSSVSRETLP